MGVQFPFHVQKGVVPPVFGEPIKEVPLMLSKIEYVGTKRQHGIDVGINQNTWPPLEVVTLPAQTALRLGTSINPEREVTERVEAAVHMRSPAGSHPDERKRKNSRGRKRRRPGAR